MLLKVPQLQLVPGCAIEPITDVAAQLGHQPAHNICEQVNVTAPVSPRLLVGFSALQV